MRFRHTMLTGIAGLLLSITSLGADHSELADAVMRGDKALARALMEQRADVNAPQADGATALHWAVYRDDLQMAELLIRAGANVNAANREGASVLSLKRHAEKFSQLSETETAELATAASCMEKALGEAFSYDKINYLMLMMVDPHVHFHVVPRYSSPRSFGGREWADAGWPKLPVLTGEPPKPETLAAVAEKLKALL